MPVFARRLRLFIVILVVPANIFVFVELHKVAVLRLGEDPADRMRLAFFRQDLLFPLLLADRVDDLVQVLLGRDKRLCRHDVNRLLLRHKIKF